MLATPRLHTIVSLPFEENSYVAWLPGRSDAVVFDPGLEPEMIVDFLRTEKLTPAAILNTHGHADHIAGNGTLKKFFRDAPLVIGVHETHLLSDAEANLSAVFGLPLTSPPADRTVVEGETIEYAGMAFEVREIPGHSPGHVVFIYRSAPVVVFGGDVLFQGSVGRTDFPGGSGPLLVRGIRDKLFNLPDDTIIYPGHGPETTIGEEKRTNPFVGGET